MLPVIGRGQYFMKRLRKNIVEIVRTVVKSKHTKSSLRFRNKEEN